MEGEGLLGIEMFRPLFIHPTRLHAICTDESMKQSFRIEAAGSSTGVKSDWELSPGDAFRGKLGKENVPVSLLVRLYPFPSSKTPPAYFAIFLAFPRMNALNSSISFLSTVPAGFMRDSINCIFPILLWRSLASCEFWLTTNCLVVWFMVPMYIYS